MIEQVLDQLPLAAAWRQDNRLIRRQAAAGRAAHPSVSAALRAALTAELASLTGSARPDLFFAQ
jgi:ribosomal protein S12 methylthiotransferase accessory factor YcaO